MRPTFRLFFVLLTLATMSAPSWGHASDVTIQTLQGAHTFSVEVMRTPAERSQGLMHRKYLAPDAGMLFDFGQPTPVSMWMKNTYIPLDMLFITEAGKIQSIEANTTPLSTEIISSRGRVRFVLEVNAGTAEEKGIKVGDQVTLPKTE